MPNDSNDRQFASRARRLLSVAAWIATGINAAFWLCHRIDTLPRYHGKSVHDLPTDKWFLTFSGLILLSILGIALRWGVTIPCILLGAFFVGPALAQVNQSEADDAIRSLICAFVGVAIGSSFDLLASHLTKRCS